MSSAIESRAVPLPDDDPRWSSDLRHYQHDGRPLALFAVLAASDRALADLRAATTACFTSPLPVRFREVLVLRICARTTCWSEWNVHVAMFGQAADLTDADLLVLRGIGTLDREQLDHLAVELADAVVAGPDLSDSTWRRLVTALGSELALDSLMVAGQYLKVAWLANAVGLNL